MKRKITVLVAGITGFLQSVAGATNSTASQISYSDALNVVLSPESYAQAVELLQMIGQPLALVVGLPFLMLVLAGGIAEYRGRKFWGMGSYWVIVISVFMAILMVLVAFPYLVMYLR